MHPKNKKFFTFSFSKQSILLISLILTFVLTLLVGDYLNEGVKSFFFAISIAIKQAVMLIIPIMVVIFLSSSLLSFQRGIFSFAILLFITVFISNYIAILFAYLSSTFFLPHLSIVNSTITNNIVLSPLWETPSIKLISTQHGLILGLFIAMSLKLFPNARIENLIAIANKKCVILLKTYFTPILPLFIFGFLLKTHHEKIFVQVINSYKTVFIILLITQLTYLSFLFLLATNFKLKKCLTVVKNCFPALLTGLSTSSSAATMPITILSSEKNIKDHSLVHSIIPATANNHLVGTAIGINFIIISSFYIFGLPIPSAGQFLTFALLCSVSLFMSVGVMGGAVFVLLPIIESTFGIGRDVSTLITAIVLLIDPIDTTCNIGGNCAFAIIFSKLYERLFPSNSSALEVKPSPVTVQ